LTVLANSTSARLQKRYEYTLAQLIQRQSQSSFGWRHAENPPAARSGARRHCKALEPKPAGRLCGDIGFYEDTDTCIGVPHFPATQYLRTRGIKPEKLCPAL
jgi:hypothetical protein